MSTRYQAYGWLLLNTILWGAAFASVKPALEFTTPIRYLFYRYLVAVIFSLPILWHYRHTLLGKKNSVWQISKIEIIGTTLALWLLYAGLQLTTTIHANFLAITTPLFITAGGIWLLKEKQEKHEWIGLAVSFLGTVLLTLFAQTNGHTSIWQISSLAILGGILILLSNLANMFYFPFAKKAYKKLPKFYVTTISFYVGVISFFLLSLGEVGFSVTKLFLVMQSDLQHPSVWFAAVYMAVFGSILGLTAYIKGQHLIETSEASLFYYLQPIVALPLGIYFLDEKTSVRELISFAIVVAGVFIAQKRKWRL